MEAGGVAGVLSQAQGLYQGGRFDLATRKIRVGVTHPAEDAGCRIFEPARNLRGHPTVVAIPQNEPWNNRFERVEEGFQIHHQVLQLSEMGKRLQDDRSTAGCSLLHQCLTGQRRLPVDAYGARTANGAPAGTAKSEAGVLLPGEQQSVQHRLGCLQSQRKFLEPGSRIALRIKSTYLENRFHFGSFFPLQDRQIITGPMTRFVGQAFQPA